MGVFGIDVQTADIMLTYMFLPLNIARYCNVSQTPCTNITTCIFTLIWLEQSTLISHAETFDQISKFNPAWVSQLRSMPLQSRN